MTAPLKSAASYVGPDAYSLADWRRQINDLYAEVRAKENPADAWAIWRQRRDSLFAHHPMSPLSTSQRDGFQALSLFDYNPALRFEVDLHTHGGDILDYDLGTDGGMRAKPAAATVGLADLLGGELTVYWITGYGGGLFIPFKDETSGRETYGGGRYLVDAIKGADLGLSQQGRLILDFNFAYNPSCAFNDSFVCPLPPRENTFPHPVRAGERSPEFSLPSS